jgi:SAM-dependent methyltransferase
LKTAAENCAAKDFIMVNIVQRAGSSPVVDQEAMQAFLHQWQVYRKLVDHDYLSHQGTCAALHRQLVAQLSRPFRFLDLACGDASLTVAALEGTRVSHYEGIDLSGPALAMAREAVKALACPVQLEQRDFVSAIRERQESADVV